MSCPVLLRDLCLALVFGVAWSLANVSAAGGAAAVPSGNCSCGGFPSAAPAAGSAPLLSQQPGLQVLCDDAGAETCKALCGALATATKAKGPEILCNRLKDANELKLSAFYKICERPWTFVGMTAEAPLCCHDSAVTTCPSAATPTPAPVPAPAPAPAPAPVVKMV